MRGTKKNKVATIITKNDIQSDIDRSAKRYLSSKKNYKLYPSYENGYWKNGIKNVANIGERQKLIKLCVVCLKERLYYARSATKEEKICSGCKKQVESKK